MKMKILLCVNYSIITVYIKIMNKIIGEYVFLHIITVVELKDIA